MVALGETEDQKIKYSLKPHGGSSVDFREFDKDYNKLYYDYKEYLVTRGFERVKASFIARHITVRELQVDYEYTYKAHLIKGLPDDLLR